MAARFLAGTAALGVAALAAPPAVAQQIYYEDGDYLYAVPVPATVQDSRVREQDEAFAMADEDGVTYRPDGPRITAQRVIPSRNAPIPRATPQIILPAPQPDYAYPTQVYQTPVYQSQAYPTQAYPGYAPVIYAPVAQVQPGYGGAARSIPSRGYGYAPAPQPYGYATAVQQPGYLPGGGQLVAFDRDAWLNECSSRLSTYEDSDRGQVLGGLLGAAAGGLIGNRVAGSGDRLGGTLIGAGTGALAGLAVGDAIDDRNDARSGRSGYEECRAYLDDYMNRASNNPAPMTTVPGQQYMLVPVSVPVAQQLVYRDAPGSQP